MRAAELIATKYRYDMLAATMVGQVGVIASIRSSPEVRLVASVACLMMNLKLKML